MESSTPNDNGVLSLILCFFIQAGIWVHDGINSFSLATAFDVCYNAAKLLALIASIWASYRVGTKNKKE
jgi:hypothetical protein